MPTSSAADTTGVNFFVLYKQVTGTFGFLLSKWKTLLLVGFIFGLMGVAYAWLQKPLYIAEMRFVTEEDEGGGLGMYAGIAAQFGIDIGSSGGGAFQGENLVELLKSRTLVEQTLLTPASATGTRMIELYISNHDLKKSWQKTPGLSDLQFTNYPLAENRLRDSVVGIIYNRIIKESLTIGKDDKKLNIVTLGFKDNNEVFAKRFVELLVANAIDYYTRYKSERSRQNIQILQKQTDSVRNMLYGNINQVAGMNDLNVNPIRQTVKAPSQRKQADLQANAALYEELVKNLELSKIALRKETPLIQVIDSPKLPLEKKKLGRLLTGLIGACLSTLIAAAILLLQKKVREAKANFYTPATTVA